MKRILFWLAAIALLPGICYMLYPHSFADLQPD